MLPGLLKGYLHKKLELSNDKKVDISTYPAVQGYYIEAEFFNHSFLEVAILLDNRNQSSDGYSSTILIFSGYRVSCLYEVLETMTMNTLYHLRNDNPIWNTSINIHDKQRHVAIACIINYTHI